MRRVLRRGARRYDGRVRTLALIAALLAGTLLVTVTRPHPTVADPAVKDIPTPAVRSETRPDAPRSGETDAYDELTGEYLRSWEFRHVTLFLQAGGRYTRHEQTSGMFTWPVETGAARVRDGCLVLKRDASGAAGPRESTHLRIVRWDDALLLVPNDHDSFAELVNGIHGGGPSSVRGAASERALSVVAFVRQPALQTLPFGEPELPPEWAARVRRRPLMGEVVFGTLTDPGSAGTPLPQVLVNLGSRDGVYEGLELRLVAPYPTSSRGVVRLVRERQCQVEVTHSGATGWDIGAPVTTGAFVPR